MPTYREWVSALRDLLGSGSRALVAASLQGFPPDVGGPEALVGALASTCELVVMPAFTRRTLVTPPFGPADNGMRYGEVAANYEVEVFHPDLPVDSDIGAVAETLRRHPEAQRSAHPALSFVGLRADEVLARQSLDEPLGPVHWLAEADGDVVLIGVDQRSNLGLHYAERVAGRKAFLRWALTEEGVVLCPQFPGCADGFPTIQSRLAGIARRTDLAGQTLEAVPLRDLVHLAAGWMGQDPRALLCDRPGCERCADVRTSVRAVAP